MREQEADRIPESDAATVLRYVLIEIGHELRASLHNILSLGYALKATDDKEKMDTIYQYLKAEIYLARMTLDNIYSLQWDLETRPMDRQRVDMTAIVAECADTVHAIASRRNIAVDVSGATTQATVLANPELLRMALLNIIHNAVKYAYANTKVDVRIEERDSDILISVKDRGIGIPDTATEHVFDAFWRGARDHRRSLLGAGLGLYAAKRALDAHKAHITVESTPIGPHVSKSSEFEATEQYLVTVVVRIPKT
jgi:signal transduction histidine kinase